MKTDESISNLQPSNTPSATKTLPSQKFSIYKNYVNLLLIGFIIVLLSTTSILAYKYYELKQHFNRFRSISSNPPTGTIKTSPSPELSPQATTVSTVDWQLQTHESKNGYIIKIPLGWYFLEDSVNHNEFMLRNCNPNELCMENVVTIRFSDFLYDNSNNLPIESWVEQQNFEYKYYDERITPVKSVINVASQVVVKMSDDKHYQYWIYVPIKDKILRIFSTITSSNNQYFEDHRGDLDQILSTFKFINKDSQQQSTIITLPISIRGDLVDPGPVEDECQSRMIEYIESKDFINLRLSNCTLFESKVGNGELECPNGYSPQGCSICKLQCI